MITDILYRCPNCGGLEQIQGTRCTSCNAEVAALSRSEVSVNGEKNTIAYWYRKILNFDLPVNEAGIILESRRAVLSRETGLGVYRGLGGVSAARYTRAVFDEGPLVLKRDGIAFSGRIGTVSLQLEDITGVTIESNTIILNSRTRGVHFFDFPEESGKKWEDLVRRVLSDYHAPRKIREFYPRLRFEEGFRDRPAQARGHTELKVPVRKWYRLDTSIPLAVVRFIARPVIRSLFKVDIKGLENIPASGAAILLSNHTSFLDSIILGALPKRHIWFMAKNSEYKGPLLTWALRQARAFPVRRYAVDVQAVRNAVRIVRQGHILGIYPEGERTWDSTLLPFRDGTMRLVLALSRPVIPVGISGAYKLMPRWESTIERVPVKVRIGKPFMLGHIPLPQQTRSDIDKAKQTLRTHILNLIGEEH